MVAVPGPAHPPTPVAACSNEGPSFTPPAGSQLPREGGVQKQISKCRKWLLPDSPVSAEGGKWLAAARRSATPPTLAITRGTRRESVLKKEASGEEQQIQTVQRDGRKNRGEVTPDWGRQQRERDGDTRPLGGCGGRGEPEPPAPPRHRQLFFPPLPGAHPETAPDSGDVSCWGLQDAPGTFPGGGESGDPSCTLRAFWLPELSTSRRAKRVP